MEKVLMKDQLTYLEAAKIVYADLSRYLKERVIPLRVEYEKRHGDPEYKAEFCFNSFNLLLQFSFLEIALSDAEIKESEIKAITEICGDELLPEIVSELVGQKFVMEDFLRISPQESNEILKAICKEVFNISKDFWYSFDIFMDDSSSEKDCLDYLEKCAIAFLTCIRSIDGEVKEEETCKCMLIYIIEKLKEGKKKIKPVEPGTGVAPNEKVIKGAEREVEAIKAHRSLKDCYQKKKVSLKESEHQVDYRDKIKATVYIEVEYGDGNSGSGSGFVITESGLCFTCYHVVKDAQELYVRLDDGNGNRVVKPAILQYFDEPEDFAVIQILDIEWAYYFKLEDNYSEISMGDEIAIFGFPLGRHINEDVLELEPSLLRGYIACKNRLEDKLVYYLDARSCQGNSGGPVFALKSNKVIGYLCGSYGPDRANLVFCRSLTEFFKKVVNK